MDVKLISIIGAVIAISIGSIGPALAEGRSVAAAMDAIARQPEAAGTISRTLFVGLAMIETMAIYCLDRYRVTAAISETRIFPRDSMYRDVPGGARCNAGPRRRSRLVLSRGTDSLQTPRWRKADSNSQSHARSATGLVLRR